MATLREIRKKIKATKSIQKTTRAMQMISTARFQKAQSQMLSSRPYFQKIQELLDTLIKKSAADHPFFKSGSADREGLIVITSEKGLCGSHNTNIIKKTVEYIADRPTDGLELSVIGKEGRDYFRRNGMSVNREYFDVFRNFTPVRAEVVADEIVKSYTAGKLKRFSAVYASYKSFFSHPVVVTQVLPIEKLPGNGSEFDYFYEPEKDVIIDKLLNRYMKTEIFRILIEAYASEIAARRNAMENATRNADELIDGLTLYLNKIRQQQITKELTEIVSANEGMG